MPTQHERFETFQGLHRRPGAFIIPNPWDAGTARILTALGFEALATTSAGFAFAIGRRDSAAGLTREEVLANARQIVEATDLPVSGDLEDGFGADPASCAATIREAVAVGLVGGSVEDATGDPTSPIYAFEHAVERIAAASEAAQGQPFLLTARAENFLHGVSDLDDTIRRFVAFSAAGADVLYAPGLPSLAAIRCVCESVEKPVNVVMGLRGPTFRIDELAEVGVKRVSLGGSLARSALGAVITAGREMLHDGTFTFSATAVPDSEVSAYMRHEDRASRGTLRRA
jgi:2-methylisocitrate lyase-like PEP mutase family enzyme